MIMIMIEKCTPLMKITTQNNSEQESKSTEWAEAKSLKQPNIEVDVFVPEWAYSKHVLSYMLRKQYLD